MTTYQDYEEDFEMVSRRVRVVDEHGEAKFIELT